MDQSNPVTHAEYTIHDPRHRSECQTPQSIAQHNTSIGSVKHAAGNCLHSAI